MNDITNNGILLNKTLVMVKYEERAIVGGRVINTVPGQSITGINERARPVEPVLGPKAGKLT